MIPPRLARAFAASLALHLLALGLLAADPQRGPARRAPPTVIQARLVPLPPPPRPAPAPLPPAADGIPAPEAGPPRPGAEMTPARFLAPPDLSSLEDIPVPAAGRVELRLRVAADGRVEDVVLRRTDPVPTALIDGLRARLAATRLEPARVDGRPVASELDLVIHAEPGIEVPER